MGEWSWQASLLATRPEDLWGAWGRRHFPKEARAKSCFWNLLFLTSASGLGNGVTTFTFACGGSQEALP
jgi:hypothetical protein